MVTEVRVAGADDMKELWRLNHEIYCRELRQHEVDQASLKVDRMHAQAIYFIARVDGVVAGMLSVTMPGSGKISTLERIPYNEGFHGAISSTTEVRLLAVDRKFRGRRVYDHLIFFLMQFCGTHSIHRILISAVEKQVRLYELMGFERVGGHVVEGGCVLQPMLLLRENFEKSPYRLKTLAKMERE